ncbi:sensor histidine kinase [Sunxiuqinia elliptica]|uniref:histidine kinase n=1 Tax=Sunxiuqinia elliptica TaxID=655355 RepID=A0A4R6GXY1_9BACT|nr:ATP-binding protein [Sunxiuqinia elliptica]TDN99850.1 signal transduction histidine kinase [Sunxiuqinia elliptica]TDO57042.1 signal transduction histidine kinase [Sunxiuqinia elliptica]
MVLQILLVITIILQFFAVGVAIKLTRVTKYNFSWILLTIGFIFMGIRRLVEFLPFISDFEPQDLGEVFVWFGVVISVSFAIGVFMIQRIFKYMKRVEDSRRLTEKMFLNAIIQTEEKERKRFAKDLHDGLGPLLSTVKMSVSSLAQLEHDKASQEIVANTEMVINEAIKSLKEISDNLSPHVLNNFGLLRALRNFTNKINATKAIRIQLKSNLADERFSNNIEVVLYRVVCELINNTIKHASAKNISIDLQHQEGALSIDYRDNGKGFNKEKLEELPMMGGMGFSNIYSRINSLKGDIQIESEPKKGTHVYIQVNTENE